MRVGAITYFTSGKLPKMLSNVLEISNVGFWSDQWEVLNSL